MKRFLPVVLLMLFTYSCGVNRAVLFKYYAENHKPAEIEAEGDYVHEEAQVVFPEKFKKFKREKVYSYSEENNDISANYLYSDSIERTEVSVYVYPAEEINSNSLWEQYSGACQPISDSFDSDNFVEQYVVPVERDGYRTNGLYARLEAGRYSTSLTIFPCGKWYLKYRITSNYKNKFYFNSLRDSMIKAFDPLDIIKNNPVKVSYSLNIDKSSIADTNLMAATFGRAASALKWTLKDVSSKENCSGLPVAYLDFYTGPIKDMVTIYDELMADPSNAAPVREYITSLKKIIDNGYLNECVMEKYYKVLIPKDNTNLELRYDEYDKWKEEHLPDFDLGDSNFEIRYTVRE